MCAEYLQGLNAGCLGGVQVTNVMTLSRKKEYHYSLDIN